MVVLAAAVDADLSVAAVRALGGRPEGDAVTAGGVEAEELSAHPIVFLQGWRERRWGLGVYWWGGGGGQENMRECRRRVEERV